MRVSLQEKENFFARIVIPLYGQGAQPVDERLPVKRKWNFIIA